MRNLPNLWACRAATAFAAVLVICVHAAPAQRTTTTAADRHAVEIPKVSRIVRRYVPEEAPGGVAVLITRDGDVIHRMGYGSVKGRPVTCETPLKLASITKQYAGVCAAMLIATGRLDPKQSVSHYLPELDLPTTGRELLVQDLFWHTSGLPNFIQKAEQLSIAEFKRQRGLDHLSNRTHAEWLTTMPVRRPPGQRYEYTNSGYVLLTRIIEVVTGESFHEFQQARIFDVLDLTGTTDSTLFNGSGNMSTTLVDYTKWDRALWERDARLLSPEGYKLLFTRGKLDSGDPVDYGIGWQLQFRDGELVIAEHGGSGSGTTAARNWIRRHLADRTTVAIFAQEHPQLIRERRKALVGELYKAISDHHPNE